MKKSNKGFTLVELIVVIAIIGILAAILVPALAGYIRDSKITSANSSAKTVYNGIMAYTQKLYANSTPIIASAAGTAYKFELSGCGATDAPETSDYNFGGSESGVNTPGSAEYALHKAAASSLGKSADGSYVGISINADGFPSEVAWAKSKTEPYVGYYPKPAEKETDGGLDAHTFS